MTINSSLYLRQNVIREMLTQAWQPLNRISQLHCAASFSPPNLCLKYLLQIIIASIYWIIVVILAWEKMYCNLQQRNNLEQFMFGCRFLGSLFICATIFVGCHRQRNLYPDFVNRIANIHVQMEMYISIEPCNRLRYCIRRLLVVFVFLEIITSILQFGRVHYDFQKTLIDVLILQIPSMISILALMQYIGLLYILTEEFHNLNEVIHRNNCPEWQSREMRVVYSLTPILSQRRQEHNKNYENVLKTARRLHIQLIELYEQGSSAFGILLVSVYVQTMLQFIIQVYLVYRYAVNLLDFDWFRFFLSIEWTILHVGPLFAMFFVADLLQKEVRNLTFYIILVVNNIILLNQISRSATILFEVDTTCCLISSDHISNVIIFQYQYGFTLI